MQKYQTVDNNMVYSMELTKLKPKYYVQWSILLTKCSVFNVKKSDPLIFNQSTYWHALYVLIRANK